MCVTGVSGSGKSTLVQDILHPALRKHLGKPTETPGAFRSLEGTKHVNDIVFVDQSPIGRTTRSNPASYVGAFDAIRETIRQGAGLASTRGYTTGTFSFNSGNGRCPTCSGNGFEHVEMQFLSDVYLRCPDCNGKRYRDEVLEVKVDGRSIADVLELTISGGALGIRPRRERRPLPAAPRGRGARLPPPRPARSDAFGRRGAAPQARRASGRSRGPLDRDAAPPSS